MSLIPSFFGGRRANTSFDPFALGIWDPFKDFTFPELSRKNFVIVNTQIDWKETPKAHVFKADLPGLKKEEVEGDRVLNINRERKFKKEEKNDTWHRIENSSGKFQTRFKLPKNAKIEEIKASIENGVLSVTIPKVEIKNPEVKSIDISS